MGRRRVVGFGALLESGNGFALGRLELHQRRCLRNWSRRSLYLPGNKKNHMRGID